MPFEIEQKLVVAIASSALFDLGEADRVFRQQGEDAYRRYQREHEVEVLERGVAFPFIKRLLSFNRSPDDSPVEVVLLSRNDPDTGLRVFNSSRRTAWTSRVPRFSTATRPFGTSPTSTPVFFSQRTSITWRKRLWPDTLLASCSTA